VRLTINNLPLPGQAGHEIKLFVTAGKSGTYTLKKTALEAIPQAYEVWLMDKYKKDSLNLRNSTNYAFDINLADTASFGNSRFAVVVRQSKASNLQLLSFTGAKTAKGSQVAWATRNEENYTHFTVERSTDGGSTFNAIGGIPPTGAGRYDLLDKAPAPRANMYRLRMEDINGNITYSKVVTLMYNSTNTQVDSPIALYPNPAQGTINLTIKPVFASNTSTAIITSDSFNTSESGLTYNIKIVNSSGMVVKTESTKSKDWHADVKNLLPGTYVMQVYNSKDNSLVGKGSFVKL
jgi:hypothetical protein